VLKKQAVGNPIPFVPIPFVPFTKINGHERKSAFMRAFPSVRAKPFGTNGHERARTGTNGRLCLDLRLLDTR